MSCRRNPTHDGRCDSSSEGQVECKDSTYLVLVANGLNGRNDCCRTTAESFHQLSFAVSFHNLTHCVRPLTKISISCHECACVDSATLFFPPVPFGDPPAGELFNKLDYGVSCDTGKDNTIFRGRCRDQLLLAWIIAPSVSSMKHVTGRYGTIAVLQGHEHVHGAYLRHLMIRSVEPKDLTVALLLGFLLRINSRAIVSEKST